MSTAEVDIVFGVKRIVGIYVMKIGPKPLLFIPGTPRLIRGNYFLD